MTVRLDWRVGPRGEGVAAGRDAPDARGPGRPARRASDPAPAGAGPGRLALVGAGLLGAALIGFHLGRSGEARASVRRAVSAELAIEAHAVRTGDPDLFLATLDPTASPAWRHAALVRFAGLRGAPWTARIVALAPGTDGVVVTVEVAAGGEAPTTETRAYVVRDGRWVRGESADLSARRAPPTRAR